MKCVYVRAYEVRAYVRVYVRAYVYVRMKCAYVYVRMCMCVCVYVCSWKKRLKMLTPQHKLNFIFRINNDNFNFIFNLNRK